MDWDTEEIQPAEPRLGTSQTDKVFGGVCGGIAHYVGLDPVIVRIGVVLLVCVGVGVLVPAYLVLMCVLPKEDARSATGSAPSVSSQSVGWILACVGAIWFLREVHWVQSSVVLALAMIAIGIRLVFRRS